MVAVVAVAVAGRTHAPAPAILHPYVFSALGSYVSRPAPETSHAGGMEELLAPSW